MSSHNTTEARSLLLVEDLPIPGVEGSERVRVVQLNRPERKNALNTQLLRELEDALRNATTDETVRAVMLTSEGDLFSAGGDIHEFKGDAYVPELVMERSRLMIAVTELLRTAPVPTIAAVQGPAIGGGALIALACDMLVVTPDTWISFPEYQSGVVPSLVIPGAIATLGRVLAFELLTTGRPLDADEGVRGGVFARSVPDGELRDSVLGTVSTWARVPRTVTRQSVGIIRECLARSSDEAGAVGLEATRTLLG